MVHGKKRIPYWIDRRLNGLAGPEYDAIISFGLPFEPEDSQYGESWLNRGHSWRDYSCCPHDMRKNYVLSSARSVSYREA